MPGKDDITFGYNPGPFEKGLKKSIDALGKFGASVKNMGKQIVGEFLKVGVIIEGAKGLIHKFSEGAPEIGKAFNIASDIFFKNFFYPLRQALLPVLQKLLDWVRDHRTLFVKWGETLVSVFRVVSSLASGLWNILKQLYQNAIEPIIKKFFGSGGLGDIVNTILTKVAVAAAFASEAISRLFAGSLGQNLKAILGDIVEIAVNIAKIAWNLLTGFFEGISKSGVVEAIRTFADFIAKLTGSPAAQQFFHDFGEAIGKLAGAVIKDVLLIFQKFIDAASKTGVGKGLLNLFDAVTKLLSNPAVVKFFDDAASWLGKTVGNGLADAFDFLASVINVIIGLIDTLSGKKVNWAAILGGVGKAVGKSATHGAFNVGELGLNTFGPMMVAAGLAKQGDLDKARSDMQAREARALAPAPAGGVGRKTSFSFGGIQINIDASNPRTRHDILNDSAAQFREQLNKALTTSGYDFGGTP